MGSKQDKESKVVADRCFRKIRDFFNGDTTKTWTWFKSPNPNLGMVSPLDMIRVGRINKLEKFIDAQLKGYWP